MQIGAATVESSVEYPQKSKWNCLWPNDSISGNLSKEAQNTNWKEYKYPYVHSPISYNIQDLKAAQVSISRWMDKQL